MTTSKSKDDIGQAEAQAEVDEQHEQGFRGVEVDPTPNEHYTVPGVLAGKPTPENDPEHARKVRAELQEKAHG